MTSPRPLVPFKNQCSIIHDNILYVYTPNAFQALPLTKNATWSQLPNGVSVTGASCVKGGLDGDSADPALYVVGGTTNDTTSGYTGIQRYSIKNKVWDTITPVTAVTANRINHGATYLNASSAILVYGGSQNGDTGLSTETFLMLMYPPYRVQAYSSTAPAVIRPFVLPWSNDQAVMVGGGSSNQKVFVFHPDPGWYDLGLALPNAIPDSSIAQCNMQLLDDGTKILQTYYLNESPNRITRNVLLNAGYQPAWYGETIGDATSTAASPTSSSSRRGRTRRQVLQQSYPAYNSTGAPTEPRLNFALADGGSLVAVVGGDANNTLAVFDSSRNSWLANSAIFGSQQPLTTSTSVSATSTVPTSTPTSATAATTTPSSSSTLAATAGDSHQSNGLAILGGVLGGICGLAGILIILLLWLRSVRRRRRAAAAAATTKEQQSPYDDDKTRRGDTSFDGNGMQPLSKHAQPMGRSPVPSAVPSDAGTIAMFGGKFEEKQSDNDRNARSAPKLNPVYLNNNDSKSNLFKGNKSNLVISKPMLPDLGDYQDRPSIDLGKATPSAPPVLPPVAGLATKTSQDQRRTDEGWAKYFQSDEEDRPRNNRATVETVATAVSDNSQNSRPSTRKGGGGGFWPGSGVPIATSTKTKLPRCDSEGNPLNQFTVSTNSPNLESGTSAHSSRNAAIAAPTAAKISSAESISTDHTSDDEYEDDHLDGYSDVGRGSVLDDHHHQHQNSIGWTPVGGAWTSQDQRSMRPPSGRIVGALDFPLPSSVSENTMHTSSTGGSSIPAFPMPNSMARARPVSTNTHLTAFPISEHPAPMHFAATVTPLNPPVHTHEHARKSSNTLALNTDTGLMHHDYFGPGPVITHTPSNPDTIRKIPDSTDMSWINLGTPSLQHHHDSVDSPTTTSSHDPA